jgi:hypothetical protein
MKKTKTIETTETEKWTIFDLDKTEHQESTDYIKDTGTGTIKWEGKLDTGTDTGIFDFRYEDYWTEDNGGSCGRITSPRPKNMSEEEWDNFQEIMEIFLDDEYTKNKQDWRGNEI